MKEIIVRKLHLDGIPISIYETQDTTDKPLIFSFHGFDGYKDGDYFKREDDLARLGFIVVGLDSILHGERRIAPFEAKSYEEKMKDINHCICQSAIDAISLYEKYLKYMPRVKPNEVYAIGVSMGGAISIYMSTLYPLKKAVSIVGSPSMVDFYKMKQKKYGWEEDFYYERNMAYYAQLDPSEHMDKIKCPLFLTAGIQDEVIPLQLIQSFTKDNITVKTYDTGHMPNQVQFDDAYHFLLSKEDV